MHHGAIIGGENGSRVIDNRDGKFCLRSASICADTTNGEVAVGRKAAERITRLICRTQNANTRRSELAALDLLNLGVRV